MLRKFLSLLLLCLCTSCTYYSPKIVDTPDFRDWASSSDKPKIAAILPFTNETKLDGLDRLVRESFYKHFSVRNFFDIELQEVDGIIKVLEEAENKDFREIPPQKLGELLRCDALVYGRVFKFKRVFFVIYAQMVIGAEMSIVETQSGKELWKYSLTKRFHEGGIPIGPFEVIPAAIRTTFSLRESRKTRDVDAFCKDFVSRMPDVHHLQARRIEELCNLQIASFKLKEGALHISSTQSQQGYKPFLREAHKNDEIWYRVMIGPFVSREEAERYQVKLSKEFTFLSPIVVRSEESSGSGIENVR